MLETDPTRLSPWQRADQRAAEASAARILASEPLRQARAQVAHLWRLAYGENASPEALARFDAAMDEYCANYVLKAIASDAQHPRFVCNFMAPRGPAAEGLFGARIGGDNPDNCYRLAGIEHGARYRVDGRVRGAAPSHVSFTLVANYGTSVTIQTLEPADLDRDAGGAFSIEIDAEPAGGRRNHMRTAPGVKFLFVRDSLNDWQRELPLALEIERLAPPRAEPIDDPEITRRAVFRMVEDVPLYYWFTRLFSGRPVNTLTLSASAPLGGLVTQAGAQGRFQLGADEALVVRVDPAEARYFSIVAYDWWLLSIDPGARCSSRSTAMTKLDADGCATYVLGGVDPGVANWIDTAGLQEGLLLCRWQGLAAPAVRGGPRVHGVTRTPLAQLDRHLLAGMRRVTPDERAAQGQMRQRAYQRRFEAIA